MIRELTASTLILRQDLADRPDLASPPGLLAPGRGLRTAVLRGRAGVQVKADVSAAREQAHGKR
jgi:hypothetical protein